MGKATDKLSNNMKVTLKIEGMTCASCVGRVETALKKVDGVQSASVNLATERADIVLDQPVDRQVLVHAIEQSGYDVPANNIELSIKGMTCASCVGRVEKALRSGDLRHPDQPGLCRGLCLRPTTDGTDPPAAWTTRDRRARCSWGRSTRADAASRRRRRGAAGT